jgi:hypothetical protein
VLEIVETAVELEPVALAFPPPMGIMSSTAAAPVPDEVALPLPADTPQSALLSLLAFAVAVAPFPAEALARLSLTVRSLQ